MVRRAIDYCASSLYRATRRFTQVGNKGHGTGPFHIAVGQGSFCPAPSRLLFLPKGFLAHFSLLNTEVIVRSSRLLPLVAVVWAAAAVRFCAPVSAGDEWQRGRRAAQAH